ncbi:MAG: transglycosylase SLT domain-containing protein, partial [Pseudolabrys sp.]|nr:transglycosylase SLT domain-containing protein [Pseudolabrys sp.]
MLVQPANAHPYVTGAIRQAAASTGTSFGYLLATAQIESNLNPSAKASTSSATGLFQFIDQTWLQTVKQSGAAHGLGKYAAAITRNAEGQYEVADAGMRAAIMGMRSNPKINATMGAAYTRSNSDALHDGLGRAPTEG